MPRPGRRLGNAGDPPPPGPWVADAACAGTPTALWFPDGRVFDDADRSAKAICRRCPVLDDCATYIATHPQPGTWAGVTQQERTRRMRRTA